MKNLKKVISFFRDGTAEEWLGRLLVLLVVIPVVINVAYREFFSKYSTTLEAMALLGYVGIGYAMFGYLYKKDSHVDVRFVEMMLPPLGKKLVELFRDLFILAYCLVMVYWGFKLAKGNLNHLVPATRISYTWGYVLIIIGAFSGAVRSLWALLARVVRLFKGQSEAEEEQT